ncbi:MAG: IclR family transcriptional regulator, partial [Desulfuromusa sp.]|nr:IclR family transcriptional regulator [Desulfuromusa sp.]
MKNSNEKLNTVGKVIAIIETIQAANRPLSIKEIADTLELNKSSLHHHIKTLTGKGYLQQEEESRKYDIGLNLVRVGQSYLQRLDVRERGHYFLEQLSRELNETVHMMVLDRNELVYIDKVDVNHQPGSLKCSSFIGLRTDVYSTAAGKMLLSHLQRGALEEILQNLKMQPITEYTLSSKTELKKELALTKARGYALDLQEHVVGLQCVAAPILNMHSQCIAAISLSGPVATIPRGTL